MGMLSVMNTILQISMRQLLDQVPVDRETKAVLLGGPSRLSPFYQLMLARESGDWKALSELTRQLDLDANDVAGFYWQAMQWARMVSAGK
jgi:EAL and modified HD-GYP domain-containing signal transduction protein